MAETKTAAYVCSGCGIGEALDCAQLAKLAKREGKMALVREHALLCGEEGVQQIRDDIANEAVTHVMIGACSRRMKAEAFHFPEVALARANLREGVLWLVAGGEAHDEVRQEIAGEPVKTTTHTLAWDPVSAEKGEYKHFMQKEIFEQPRAIIDTLRGRISEDTSEIFLNGFEEHAHGMKTIERVCCIACGTSYYAGLVGKFMIEELSRIPVEVDLGSEFRYRDPLVDDQTLIVLISQSGETADTLAAMREGKAKGAKTLAICNAVESSLARDCDSVLYTHAGPEIGVASTKAFTSQVTALFLIALYLGRVRGRITQNQAGQLIEAPIRIMNRLYPQGMKRRSYSRRTPS